MARNFSRITKTRHQRITCASSTLYQHHIYFRCRATLYVVETRQNCLSIRILYSMFPNPCLYIYLWQSSFWTFLRLIETVNNFIRKAMHLPRYLPLFTLGFLPVSNKILHQQLLRSLWAVSVKCFFSLCNICL